VGGDTKFADAVVYIRAIVCSKVGSCPEGRLPRKDDPRVLLAPECFVPLTDRLESLFVPLDDLLDR
jgi:hypothetical protein